MKARIEFLGRAFDVELRSTEEGMEAEVDGEVMRVRIDRNGPGAVVAVADSDHTVTEVTDTTVVLDGQRIGYRVLEVTGAAGADGADALSHGQIKPPMTGRLESVRVREGQRVSMGDILFVLEAMKMRNEVRSPRDGVVAAVHEEAGAAVHTGTVVLVLEPE